jgi:hypothetical protein
MHDENGRKQHWGLRVSLSSDSDYLRVMYGCENRERKMKKKNTKKSDQGRSVPSGAATCKRLGNLSATAWAVHAHVRVCVYVCVCVCVCERERE